MTKTFAISETWLSNQIYNNEILILPSSFAIYHNGRGSHGGLVLLAVDLSIPTKVISRPNDIYCYPTINLISSQTMCVCEQSPK